MTGSGEASSLHIDAVGDEEDFFVELDDGGGPYEAAAGEEVPATNTFQEVRTKGHFVSKITFKEFFEGMSLIMNTHVSKTPCKTQLTYTTCPEHKHDNTLGLHAP